LIAPHGSRSPRSAGALSLWPPPERPAAGRSADYPDAAASDFTAIAHYDSVVFAAHLPGETPMLVIGRDGFPIDLVMASATGQR
jgi:hypothetical protein